MTSNFILNNELTYRDRRLNGWAMVRGFVLFCLFASVGVAGGAGTAVGTQIGALLIRSDFLWVCLAGASAFLAV